MDVLLLAFIGLTALGLREQLSRKPKGLVAAVAAGARKHWESFGARCAVCGLEHSDWHVFSRS